MAKEQAGNGVLKLQEKEKTLQGSNYTLSLEDLQDNIQFLILYKEIMSLALDPGKYFEVRLFPLFTMIVA